MPSESMTRPQIREALRKSRRSKWEALYARFVWLEVTPDEAVHLAANLLAKVRLS